MQLEASNREVNNSVPSKYSTEICVFSRENYLKFIGFEAVDWIWLLHIYSKISKTVEAS